MGRRALLRDGQPVGLQPKTWAVLALLLSRADEAVGKDDFLGEVWSGRFVTENVLTRCILLLRHALGDDAADPRYIRTVRGHGYQFIAPVAASVIDANELPRPRSIAIMGLRGVSHEDHDPALALGLAESLATDLSSIAGLEVKPLSATRDAAERAGTTDPLSLGRILGVDAVVEGSIQLDPRRIRVNVRVVRVADGSILLSDRCEAPIDDPFTAQDLVCQRVTQGLSLRIGEDSARPFAKRRTRHLDAYRAFVDGRLLLAKHSVPGTNEALACFDRALHIDTGYVEALVASAEAHEFLGTLGASHAGHYERMRELSTRAIRLDSGSARAHCCLGKVAWQYDWNWTGAESLLRKAVALDGNDAEVLIALSDFLAYQGRCDEALDVAERAGEVNPFSPWIHALITQALYMGGHLREAHEQGRRAVALAPGFGFSQFFLGLTLLRLDRPDEGVAQIREAMANSGRQDFIGMLGYALARAGDRAGAAAIIGQLESAAAAGAPVPPIAWAAVHHGLGDAEKAIACFRQAFEQRSWHILLLHAEPAFTTLRARPEAGALLRQLDLP
jgi:DNA-binding winged helix-turn-helix (wHTH) protein/tetratricopeptide (TPR) repeat protein